MSGLPANIQAWLGQTVIVDDAEVMVEAGLFQNFCAAVEDGNPLYWDTAIATGIASGLIAPPAMLSSWNRPHEWAPSHQQKSVHRPLELHFMVKDALELPRGIVMTQEYEFCEPMRVGDHIRAAQSLREVSDERTNKLGTGRSWIIDVTYTNQVGVIVGIETVTFFGYRRC